MHKRHQQIEAFVPLTDEAKITLGARLAEHHTEISELEAEKKRLATQYADKIKGKRVEVGELVESLNEGGRREEVPCRVEKDYRAGEFRAYASEARGTFNEGDLVSRWSFVEDDHQFSLAFDGVINPFADGTSAIPSGGDGALEEMVEADESAAEDALFVFGDNFEKAVRLVVEQDTFDEDTLLDMPGISEDAALVLVDHLEAVGVIGQVEDGERPVLMGLSQVDAMLTRLKQRAEQQETIQAGGTLLSRAARLVVIEEAASVTLLARELVDEEGQPIGTGKAQILIDELEEAGIIGPFEGDKGRKVLVGTVQEGGLDEVEKLLAESTVEEEAAE